MYTAEAARMELAAYPPPTPIFVKREGVITPAIGVGHEVVNGKYAIVLEAEPYVPAGTMEDPL